MTINKSELRRTSLFSLSAFVAVAGGAGLMLAAGVAGASVATTKHNLGTSGAGFSTNQFSGTGEICVFCHTPHGADTGAPVPIWNRLLTPGAGYQTYDQLGTSTLDATVLAVGSVSLACLSCHDGTQAMNVMINQPGSGGWNTAGGTLSGTWTGPASAANGHMSYNSVVYIGTDLKNDHPVGMQFCGGGITPGGSTPSGTCKDDSFYSHTGPPAALHQKVQNTKTVFWVDTEKSYTTAFPGGLGVNPTDVGQNGNGVRNKTDLMLYSRVGPSGGEEPFVECATCHDPHSSNITFLRVPNNAAVSAGTNIVTGSALCLSCHEK
jgi:hypothetical protein